jgi:O-antigen/teichoic acid export membrane protein
MPESPLPQPPSRKAPTALPSAAHVRKTLWVVLPAALIAAMQVITIPALSTGLDVKSLLAFQAMLSIWPWLSLASLGLEKRSRELHGNARAFTEFGAVWANVLLFAAAAGVVTALVGASLFGDLASWLVFGTLGALAGAMSPGRDYVLAEGAADRVGRTHATALFVSLAGLVVCAAAAPVPLPVVATMWVLPQLAAWAWLCRAVGLRIDRRASLGATMAALRGSLPFALQFAALALLSSFDILVLRFSLGDAALLEYVFATRSVAIAFVFSGALGNLLVRRATRADAAEWPRVLARSFAIHAAVSFAACVGFILVADPLFHALLPQRRFHFQDIDLFFALSALALARSLSEAAMQVSGRADTKRIASRVFALSLVGLGFLGCGVEDRSIDAVWHMALAWTLPAAYLLQLILATKRR